MARPTPVSISAAERSAGRCSRATCAEIGRRVARDGFAVVHDLLSPLLQLHLVQLVFAGLCAGALLSIPLGYSRCDSNPYRDQAMSSPNQKVPLQAR